jgi:hypothetical protein
MVSVRFSCGTLSLTLPQVSYFAPTGYPGLTYRPKWQRGNPKTSCSTKFRHDSEYILKPPRKVKAREKRRANGSQIKKKA